MSKTGVRAQRSPGEAHSTKTPIYVWAVYVLGGIAAVVLLLSALFTLGGVLTSEDVSVGVSPLGLVLWGGLVLLALGTWVWRRRQAAA